MKTLLTIVVETTKTRGDGELTHVGMATALIEEIAGGTANTLGLRTFSGNGDEDGLANPVDFVVTDATLIEAEADPS